jgi:ferrous iron transport protein A
MMEIETHIRELTTGAVGVVVGYDHSYRGYMGRLLMMGLTPGTKFVVLNTSSQQGIVKIMLETKMIELSKPEANALCVENVTDN